MTSRRILIALAAVLCAGCEFDLVSDPAPVARPDVSGAWVVRATGWPGGTDGTLGTCRVDEVRWTLEAVGSDHYRGTHDGVRIVCEGVTPLATLQSGIRDTVLVVPPDTLRAQVGGACIGLAGCPPSPSIFVSSGRLSFVGGPVSDRLMGGTFQYLSEDTIRVQGTFTGTRR